MCSRVDARTDRGHLQTHLLSRTALGDQVALRQLHRHTAGIVASSVRRVQPNAAQVEEIVQDVFLRVWNAAGDFDPSKGKPSTWLGSIARNAALDNLRRQKARPRQSSPAHDLDDESDPIDRFPGDRPVESYRHDRRHQAMSASLYANQHSRGPLVDQLDAMLLGAAEVDLDFNVNVTTGSNGIILGGSGGHADTAAGAKLALVATRLASPARPKVVERVGCITTPSETIDAVVTEIGVAVNPLLDDLRDRMRAAGIDVLSIEQMRDRALSLQPATRPPMSAGPDARIVGVVEYRDGRVSDVIRQAIT